MNKAYLLVKVNNCLFSPPEYVNSLIDEAIDKKGRVRNFSEFGSSHLVVIECETDGTPTMTKECVGLIRDKFNYGVEVIPFRMAEIGLICLDRDLDGDDQIEVDECLNLIKEAVGIDATFYAELFERNRNGENFLLNLNPNE